VQVGGVGGERVGLARVGLQLEHELVVRDRRGERVRVVLVVLVLGLLELLLQQVVALGFVQLGVSGPRFTGRSHCLDSSCVAP
jgi:hypothetical protein